ncbi:LysR substrate-binding domain-containing protein [Diaphorobacter caeni]|uniref:LysR substrate-binding domain-containing protein n=1 Tax=Diaphorobacter caeni TaxID=2784387 RepID=UPI00188ED373|nr:LysR substrate-binding domain-containing protein [Diaphorobacter caeni]MBF5007114.1 LysR family transcriptional regulator [Diaphorobacter caeni]
MRRIPNFVLLRAFEAAARLQSFTRAAHELHLTPSAISHQVKELEELLGRRLFVRLHRQVEVTPEGRRLHQGLSRVFDALEASCNEVGLAPEGQVLTVHCAPSLASKWLGPRLPKFMRDHPSITIRLSTGAEPLDLTTARELDVLISYGRAVQRPGVDITPMGKELIVPMCAPALRKHGLPLADQITQMTLIESQLNPVTWHDWFARNQLDMRSQTRLSFDRAAMSVSAAVDGVGIALESTRLAERELSRGELIILGIKTFQQFEAEIHFFSQRTNERHLEKIQIFKDWLFGEIRCALY